MAAESSSPRTTLALVSSYPVRHSDGSRAECAGRKRVAAIVDNTAAQTFTRGALTVFTVVVTLLVRIAPDDVLAGVFGVLESLVGCPSE